jgi:hypothetical protein
MKQSQYVLCSVHQSFLAVHEYIDQDFQDQISSPPSLSFSTLKHSSLHSLHFLSTQELASFHQFHLSKWLPSALSSSASRPLLALPSPPLPLMSPTLSSALPPRAWLLVRTTTRTTRLAVTSSTTPPTTVTLSTSLVLRTSSLARDGGLVPPGRPTLLA